MPLPMARPGDSAAGIPLSYGEYFTGIHSFLTADHGRGLLKAVSACLGGRPSPVAIDAVAVCIQKHGAFYHPARVDVAAGGQAVSFVVNVAVSPPGRAGLQQETALLDRLNDAFPRRYLPRVYLRGDGQTGRRHGRLPMFLGEWLRGYHEFHIGDTGDSFQTIRIWDVKKNSLQTAAQKTLLYRRAAEILTYYYNPETFEQIFPWHHGAGDFVVRRRAADIDLRLVTVRGYAPLVDADATDPLAVLEALLRFFLHLSLRMRIDRLDGTGALVWADEAAIHGTVRGFFDGLALKPAVSVPAGPLIDDIRYYFARLSPAALDSGLAGIVAAYPSRSAEGRLMALHLSSHGRALHESIQHISATAR